MKLPVSFDQFSKDPSKALTYLMVFAVIFLYLRTEKQSNNEGSKCEERLTACETQLRKFSAMLKTSDSSTAALRSELNTYKKLGVIN